MKNIEKMTFANMAIATMFYDYASRQNFRKLSANRAAYLTGPHAGHGKAEFRADEVFDATAPLGYQFANAEGENIQGDDNDPSGYASFEILGRDLAQLTLNANPDAGLQLYAIYPGDIESPAYLS